MLTKTKAKIFEEKTKNFKKLHPVAYLISSLLSSPYPSHTIAGRRSAVKEVMQLFSQYFFIFLVTQ